MLQNSSGNIPLPSIISSNAGSITIQIFIVKDCKIYTRLLLNVHNSSPLYMAKSQIQPIEHDRAYHLGLGRWNSYLIQCIFSNLGEKAYNKTANPAATK